MRYQILLLCLLLQCCAACAQPKGTARFAGVLPLKKGYTLVFLAKDKSSALYRQPRIKAGNTVKKIDGFDDGNFSSKRIKLSPDGNYVTVENIIRGYVQQSETDSVFHENYGCAIVDLKKAKVVHYLQSDCDGAWNKQNEWISDDKVIFSKDEQ
ncbi:hypothetical protein [Taibaiella koreensis]|uniref:hypothetical protein n=1 Tax=Taibaiella koreensis TaxID=1268548 RepID=UPI000E59AB98|nr:hypothetical protein [Taibaiella koreensis]